MQLIERMEEFLLRSFLRPERLDVIDQQYVSRAITGPQLRHPLVFDPGHHFVCKTLARGVNNPGTSPHHERPADRVHQMRLAHPYSTVDEQRVIAAGWVHRDRLRRRMRKLV